MGHVNLDPVGAVGQLLAGGLARLDRPIDELRALGHVKLRRVAFKRIASGCGNGASGNKQPRPGNVSALESLLDSDVSVTRAFGLQVAQCSEALLQRASHGNRSPRRAQCQRILQNGDVVSALRRLLTLQEDVGVRIDETGQYGRMGEIHYVRALGNLGGSCIGNAFDAVATDDNDLIVARGIGLAVDQCTGAYDSERVQHRAAFVFLSSAANHNGKQEDPTGLFHRPAPRIGIKRFKMYCAFYAWEAPITASASISTSISGEISALTCTIEVAGRMSRKNSPCALPIFSQSAMLMTNIRVRTTSFNVAPAFFRAASIFFSVCMFWA